MDDKSAQKKRIAKNTLVLYVRMIFLMAINLYTTRVVLQALGVEDYGIYNVVGGIVALFSILSKSLATASSRFLNCEMGRGDEIRLKSVFSVSLSIQVLIAVIIAILVELLGVWFLNNKMVIEPERMQAANWVLQFSVITFCFNLVSVPYNAAIIAHEKMSAFAYISIFEGIAKLAICYLVMISPFDKLIVYAGLICAIQVVIRFIYGAYCKMNFPECKYKFVKDKTLFVELFSFAGWNFIGASAGVIRTQGGNILINLFFGTSVNAARGVANQVNRAVGGFASNFMIAVKPQIMKSYASGDKEYMTDLINKSARLSYFMLLFLSLPIVLNIDFILQTWLEVVPDKTGIFVLLTVALALLESLSEPLIATQLATGKVRNYQLIVGGLMLLNIPTSYLMLKLGFDAEIYLYVAIVISLVTLIARLLMLRINADLPIFPFLKSVFFNCMLVTILSVSLPLALSFFFKNNIVGFFVISLCSVIWASIVILYVGCTKRERDFVMSKSMVILNKIRKK